MKIKRFESFETEKINESKIDAVRQEIPYETFEKDPKTGEYNSKKRLQGKSKIIDYAGRKIILMDVRGVNIPFYLSSGHGGKKDVAPGKWYPFFGLGSDGWLNKLSGKEINDYYGIDILKTIAHSLDKHIGDIRNDNSIPKVTKTGPHIAAINRGLTPTPNEMSNTLSNFKNNLENFKSRLDKATK